MDNIEKTRQFRFDQSKDKLMLAKGLYKKGDYSNSLIQSYLSLFYSVRILLLDKDSDSDDFEKITSLAERYLQPAGWISFDIAAVLREGRLHKQRLEMQLSVDVNENDAKRFVEQAETVFKEISSHAA